jgi:hypothetical protein
LGEGEVSEFVQDQQVEAAQQIGHAPLAIGTGLGIDFVDEVDHVEEAPALSSPDTVARNADGEVRFASPGAADQHEVALLIEELSASEVTHQRLVDRRVFEVELVDLLCQRQFGDRHLAPDRPRLLLALPPVIVLLPMMMLPGRR